MIAFELELAEENGETSEPPVNIGVEYKPVKQSRRDYTSVVIANHRNKDLEQAARLKTCKKITYFSGSSLALLQAWFTDHFYSLYKMYSALLLLFKWDTVP